MAHTRQAESTRDEQTARYRNWDELGEDAEHTPFKDLVQRDPTVCDHCFLYRYDTLTAEWFRKSLGGWLDYETWTAIPDRGEPVPAERPAQGMRLACGYCGYRSGEKHRPVAKAEAYRFALHIAEVLDRKGVSYDESRYVREVKARVAEPENQGKLDSAVFAPAVREAVRR